jgi:hypothetical protein
MFWFSRKTPNPQDSEAQLRAELVILQARANAHLMVLIMLLEAMTTEQKAQVEGLMREVLATMGDNPVPKRIPPELAQKFRDAVSVQLQGFLSFRPDAEDAAIAALWQD